MKNYCTYIRVSTQRQGNSGLGLESQQQICNAFIQQNGGVRVAEFKDVESGTHRERKGLADAVTYCKKNGCALVIAKLDRLARDVEFCFKIVNTGIEIHFCDMPQVNTLLLGVFASVAQYERELTSDRTTKALAAKKARGEKTGGASEAWLESYENKSKEQKNKEAMQRGKMKSERFLQSKDVQVFLKCIKNVCPNECVGEPHEWRWGLINTRNGRAQRILSMMQDYQSMDDSGTLFRKWDFATLTDRQKLVKLCTWLQTVRKSIRNNMFNDSKITAL